MGSVGTFVHVHRVTESAAMRVEIADDATLHRVLEQARAGELQWHKPAGEYVVVPGAKNDAGDLDAIQCVKRLLEHTVEDASREGLADTPRRFVAALREMTSGYDMDVDSLFKTFGDGAEGYDEMVVLRDVPFHSLCEHHLAPFFGTATIGYIPNGRVVGLSKLARCLEAYARRLQIQERLTTQVRAAVERNLEPKGVGVVLRARHFCMECRGVKKVGVETVTSALSGVLRTDAAARAEFLGLSR